MREISEQLAAALDALVRESDAAERAPGDRQAARLAIDAATVVAQLARGEGFAQGEDQALDRGAWLCRSARLDDVCAPVSVTVRANRVAPMDAAGCVSAFRRPAGP